MNREEVKALTAPCGLDCFNCRLYLAGSDDDIRKENMAMFHVSHEEAACKGCRPENGLCPVRRLNGLGLCKVYRCVAEKGIYSCAECSDFPCDNLHPFAEHASLLPHNTKVFNLALIRKMGLEKWAEEKAKSVKETYFFGKFEI
ncbi:hypothetical protein J2741_000287 [Methanolinea mesophila]|uniref:DUF3795 domain-containing protein n=1 Tax=Methanolinea mesophila TaxID=547055 RepID=UPI001AE6591D|nr:DUF3795 domain-containing protein [Methanolinea mesophila]MBP1927740.1 hypothetical protein [Methanolinea mesophila]